ncbi:MAG: hypothetical protein ABH879_10640 [archaeon]
MSKAVLVGIMLCLVIVANAQTEFSIGDRITIDDGREATVTEVSDYTVKYKLDDRRQGEAALSAAGGFRILQRPGSDSAATLASSPTEVEILYPTGSGATPDGRVVVQAGAGDIRSSVEDAVKAEIGSDAFPEKIIIKVDGEYYEASYDNLEYRYEWESGTDVILYTQGSVGGSTVLHPANRYEILLPRSTMDGRYSPGAGGEYYTRSAKDGKIVLTFYSAEGSVKGKKTGIEFEDSKRNFDEGSGAGGSGLMDVLNDRGGLSNAARAALGTGSAEDGIIEHYIELDDGQTQKAKFKKIRNAWHVLDGNEWKPFTNRDVKADLDRFQATTQTQTWSTAFVAAFDTENTAEMMKLYAQMAAVNYDFATGTKLTTSSGGQQTMFEMLQTRARLIPGAELVTDSHRYGEDDGSYRNYAGALQGLEQRQQIYSFLEEQAIEAAVRDARNDEGFNERNFRRDLQKKIDSCPGSNCNDLVAFEGLEIATESRKTNEKKLHEYRRELAWQQTRIMLGHRVYSYLFSWVDKLFGDYSFGIPQGLCSLATFTPTEGASGLFSNDRQSTQFSRQINALYDGIRGVSIKGEKAEVSPTIFRYAYTLKIISDKDGVAWRSYLYNSCTKEKSTSPAGAEGTIAEKLGIFKMHYSGNDMTIECNRPCIFDQACVQFDDERLPRCIDLINGDGFQSAEAIEAITPGKC